MAFYDWLFESDIQKEEAPKIMPEQQELVRKVAAWLGPQVGKGAAAYPGQLTAETPAGFEAAYEQFMGGIGRTDIASATRDLISGVPAYAYKPGATAKMWQETYAAPMMETWRKTVLPMVEEQYNIPGGFYSTEKGTGVARAASEFYGSQVAPSLYQYQQADVQRGFESGEAAAGRQMQATQLPFQQFAGYAQAAQLKQAQMQAPLTAAYQEYLRTRAEPGWAVQTAGQLAGMPTMDWAAFREPSMIEQIAGPVTAAAMMA